MDDVEVPGCCPLCGQGKLRLAEYSFGRYDEFSFFETASLWCTSCGASVSAHCERQTKSALWDACLAANARHKERFREGIGGFQFTD